LKIETQSLENQQVKLIIEVEPELLKDAKERAARQLAKRIKVPGFRPGKAPYGVILRQVGEPALVEEAMEILVDEVYPKAIDEAGIKPYGPGELEKIVSTDPPVFEFIIPLEADVTLGDYQSIRREYAPKVVEDKDVEKVLLDLRGRQAVVESVDRAAAEGDVVIVTLSGKRLNPEEEKDPTLVHERTSQFVVRPKADEGADEMTEWPFPGFSRELIGLSAAEGKTLQHDFSDDYEYPSLRGAQAEFELKVTEVKARTLPEETDEFAASVGEYKTMDGLRVDIRHSLMHQFEDEYFKEFDDAILSELVEKADIKYPHQMLEREIDSVVSSLKSRLAEQNLEIDLYLKTRSMDLDGLRKEAEPVAEKRLRRSLALFELAEKEGIKVDQDELEMEAYQTLRYLNDTLSTKEAKRLNDPQVYSNLVGNIAADMLSTKAVQKLREIASEGAYRPAELEKEHEAMLAASRGESIAEATKDVVVTEDALPSIEGVSSEASSAAADPE
jgi:trigger factor